MRITVTEDDFKTAKIAFDSAVPLRLTNHCPNAQAIKRAMPGEIVSVGLDQIFFDEEFPLESEIKLPLEARLVIDAFTDYIHGRKIEIELPISYEIDTEGRG